jgi:hypothetical protein
MLSFLNSWKLHVLSFALICALSYIGLLKYQNLKLDNTNQTCKANIATLQVAINVANELRTEQERKLRLKEQEAAKARAESLKRMEKIMKAKVPNDCDGAKEWMISQSHRLKFVWHNTIP